jgi:Peptidase family S41
MSQLPQSPAVTSTMMLSTTTETLNKMYPIDYSAAGVSMTASFDNSNGFSWLNEETISSLLWTLGVRYGIFRPDKENLGILRISLFSNTYFLGVNDLHDDLNLLQDFGDPYENVKKISDILQGPLAGTKGLIIDLRSNGGGLVDLATRLPQLFGAKIALPKYRLLASAGNAAYIRQFPKNEEYGTCSLIWSHHLLTYSM